MFRFSDHPLTAFEILAASGKLYQQVLGKVWYLAFAVMLLASLQKMVPGFVGAMGEDSLTADAPSIMGGLLHMAFLLVLMLISSFFVTSILHRIYLLATGVDNLSRSIQLAKIKVVTVFTAMLLITVFFGVGMILFIIPGIIVAVLAFFYLANIIFDNDEAWPAVKHSFQLVWGWKTWSQTFVVVFIPAALMVAVGPLLALMMGPDNPWGTMLGDVMIATLIVPFLNCVILLQYNNLKLQRNRAGLNQLKS